MSLFERLFQLQQHGTTVRTELLAGVTTFLTMSYIVFVNPRSSAPPAWMRVRCSWPPAWPLRWVRR
jgi:hypothetical protein